MIRTALALTAVLSLIACETSAEPPRSGPTTARASASKPAGPPSSGAAPIRVAAPTPPPAVKPAEPDVKPAERDRAERDKEDRNQPVTVDSDRMERFGKESLVIFTGNVVARQNNSIQYADRMEVYLDEKGDRIVRTVSTGNVRIITKDCRTGTAKRAEYYDAEQRVVLIGNARVWQRRQRGDRRAHHDLSRRRTAAWCEGGKQERVKAVFYPQRGPAEEDASAPAKTRGGQCCAN